MWTRSRTWGKYSYEFRWGVANEMAVLEGEVWMDVIISERKMDKSRAHVL
jgi:hypothetical protein